LDSERSQRGPLPDAPYAVTIKLRVITDDGQSLQLRLSYQHAVERVLMWSGQSASSKSVFGADGQSHKHLPRQGPMRSSASSMAVGSRPRRALVAISQAEAALPSTTFPFREISFRAESGREGSLLNHQSKVWVSCSKRTTPTAPILPAAAARKIQNLRRFFPSKLRAAGSRADLQLPRDEPRASCPSR
jgi:hypothetical protein